MAGQPVVYRENGFDSGEGLRLIPKVIRARARVIATNEKAALWERPNRECGGTGRRSGLENRFRDWNVGSNPTIPTKLRDGLEARPFFFAE